MSEYNVFTSASVSEGHPDKIADQISDEKIIQLVRENFALRPYAINNMLDLLHPMYRQTAAYGHFGRNPLEMTVGNDTFTAFPWEKIDVASQLNKAM